METENYHIMCTCQVHTCSNISDKQIKSVSESLTASANYFRKLVDRSKGIEPAPNQNQNNGKDDPVPTEDSTVSVHADSSYAATQKGFEKYDKGEIDTDAYQVKRSAYDAVRQKYPKLDDLVRDEKVRAMKELRAVGFKYYSIQVIAFVKIDGLTKTVVSKSHHRLEKPSKEYLKSLLTDTFGGTIRVEEEEASDSSKGTAGD